MKICMVMKSKAATKKNSKMNKRHECLPCMRCLNADGVMTRYEKQYGPKVFHTVQEFVCPRCGYREITEVTQVEGDKSG